MSSNPNISPSTSILEKIVLAFALLLVGVACLGVASVFWDVLFIG